MGKKKGIILLLIVLVSIIVTIFMYPYFSPADIKELDIYLKVSNYTGFNVNTSAVFFGTIMTGSKASRDLIVTNDDINAHKVNIKIQGLLKDWIIAVPKTFNLDPRENITVKLTVNVPDDAEYNNYTGKVKIIFRP